MLGSLRAATPYLAEIGAADGVAGAMFEVVGELERLGDDLPLDLRQVAALAAKRGDFQNAPYEARFAARLMAPREVHALNERLKQDAPKLAGILGLSLTEEQLRPAGTPNVKIPFGWGVFLFLTVLYGSVAIRDWKKTQDRHRGLEEMVSSLVNNTVDDARKKVERDCADPGSDECRKWAAYVFNPLESPDVEATPSSK